MLYRSGEAAWGVSAQGYPPMDTATASSHGCCDQEFAGLEEEGSRKGSTAGGLREPQHLLPPPQPASNSLGLPGAVAGL